MAGLQQATNGERKKKEEGYFGLFHMFYCSSMAYTELNLKYEGLYRINCFVLVYLGLNHFTMRLTKLSHTVYLSFSNTESQTTTSRLVFV
jgi:hypothetical protein